MTRLLLLSAALFAAVPAAAQNQPQAAPEASADAPAANPQLKTLLENCDARRAHASACAGQHPHQAEAPGREMADTAAGY